MVNGVERANLAELFVSSVFQDVDESGKVSVKKERRDGGLSTNILDQDDSYEELSHSLPIQDFLANKNGAPDRLDELLDDAV